MKKLLTRISLSVLAVLGLFSFAASPAYATDAFNNICDPNSGVSEEVRKSAGCDSDLGSSESRGNAVFNRIIGAVIAVSSMVALVFIVAGGILYITANGDPSKIKRAKDTILYSGIGLVVCALSYAIVNWVIFNAL